jgi:flagellar motility protein MotE (MotC chaperone)
MSMSGEETAAETSNPEATPKVEEGAKPEETLGDAGKKALDAERAARASAEKERNALAAKVKELEDRDKSDIDKATERLADAEKKAAENEARANRAEVAATSGVPVDVLAGPKSSSAEDITAFAELVSTYATEASKKNATGPVVLGQGKHPESAATSGDDWLRASARG